MLPYSHHWSKYALGMFFIIVIGYALFEGRGILLGPKIFVSSTAMEMHYPFVRIEGTATHIDELRMNGHPIPVTEDGNFSEPYLLALGDNRIILEAEDKYGNSAREVIEIVYTLLNATSSTAQSAASSTLPHTDATSSADSDATATVTPEQ